MLLAIALVLAQTPQHRLFEQPNLPRQNLAFFEAFPASGAGAGAACACTTPTGAKGETLTFSRASTQTCTKTIGVEPQAIASGDLVSCASGQPVVMPGADGTSVSGLLVEAQGINLTNRSEKLDNLYWTSGGLGAAAPTVTADYLSQSPFTTPTYSYAERFQFAATTAGQLSYVLATPFSAVASSASVYAMGTSGAGTIDLCIQDGASTYQCSACNFVAGSWTRCKKENVTAFASGRIVMGTLTAYNGGTARSAADVLLTAVQGEAGAVATSYVPTVAATATRVAVVPSGSVVLAGNVISIGSTWLLPSTITASASAFTVAKDASNYAVGYASGGSFVCDFVIGGVTSSITGPALSAGTAARVACTYDSTGRSACVNGACTTTAGALTLFSGASTFYFGTRTATGNEARGVEKRVCLDQGSASRCVL